MTGNPEVVRSSLGLVLINALVATERSRVIGQKRAWGTSTAISQMRTSGESARFHLPDCRLVARHNFGIARYSGQFRDPSVQQLWLRRGTDPSARPVSSLRFDHPVISSRS